MDCIYNKNQDEIKVFMPGGEGYFCYSLLRIKKPFTDGGIRQNQDLYRLYRLYLYKKTESGFEKIYDFPVTNGGEWECAVRISGTPDFHGGYHGYEHLTDTQFTENEDSLEFIQNSDIFLQGTRDRRIATHKKHYTFRDGTLFLHQELKWEYDAHIDRAFLTMLPIRRLEGDFNITDTACFEGKLYDISREGHSTDISPENKMFGREVCVFGKKSGIRATVTVDTPKNLFIQNTPQYNKVYFFYTEDSDVKCGDVWTTNSTYRFEYKRGNDND